MFWRIRQALHWRSMRAVVRRYWRWLTWGFDPYDVWSLDSATAKFLRPRLEALRDRHVGYPGHLACEDQPFDAADAVWTAIIDKIAQAMKFIADGLWDENEDRAKYVEEGIDLLGEYFLSLWD